MTLSINSAINISLLWTDFKTSTLTGSKTLSIQYVADTTTYTIFATDEAVAYYCTIWLGTVPDSVINGGYSQSQNNTDKTDFETNYKPTANALISPLPSQDAATITSNNNALLIAGKDHLNGVAHMLRTDPNGTLYVDNPNGVFTVQGSGGALTVKGNAGAGTAILATYADSTISGSLNALNAAVLLPLAGSFGVGMQLSAGTLQGTIVPEISFDNGLSYVATYFEDPATGNMVSSIVFGSNNTATARTIVGSGGASTVRVRVSAFTSGTASCALRASVLKDPKVLFAGSAGSALPPNLSQTGASVTTSAPSYSTGTLNALSLNTSGGLRVDGSGVTQPVSGTVTANAGTGNFTVTQATAANLNATVNQSTAANLNATVVQSSQANLNATVFQATASNLNANVSGTVTANIGTSGSLALDSSVNGLLLAQGTTTSGEHGPLVQGAVTTSAPTYVTGDTYPLSLTTAGALRVDASATTQPISGSVTVSGTITANQGGSPWTMQGDAANGTAVAGNPVLIGGSDGTNARTLATDSSGHQMVVGAVAAGVATSGNPVLMGGTDGTNTRTLATDSEGNLRVNTPSRTRVSVIFQGTATATADTLLSLVKVSNGTAAAGATTIAVSSNKTLRITSMVFSLKAGTTTSAFATFTLRVNPSGAAIISSQSEFRTDLVATGAVSGDGASIAIPIPDGFELSGTQQFAVSAAAQATTNVLSVSLLGYEY